MGIWAGTSLRVLHSSTFATLVCREIMTKRGNGQIIIADPKAHSSVMDLNSRRLACRAKSMGGRNGKAHGSPHNPLPRFIR
jgi:hypothetical protein